jgi:CRISPR/Cas system-associated exonuclease Cas4 (RecB family)
MKGYLYAPYSPSKFNCFDGCPKEFEYRYIKRIKIFREPIVWFEKGTFIHWVMEHYPVFPEGGFEWKLADKKLRKEWTKLAMEFVKRPKIAYLLKHQLKAEQKIATDANFRPKNSEGWDHLLVGYVDHIGYDEDGTIILIDWKTGKSVVKTHLQLQLYALWMFMASPELPKIRCQFNYLDQDEIDEFTYHREHLDDIKSFFINKIDEIESCTDFAKNPTRHCTHCDYVDRCKPFTPKINLTRTKSN